jgi:hypothetical protein
MTTRTWMMIALTAALASACGGGKKAADEPGGGASGPTCDDAAASFSGGARQSFAQMDDAAQAELTRVTAEACVNDKWSQEAIKCTAEWVPETDDDKCNDLLTETQQQNLGQAIMPILAEFLGDDEETDGYQGDDDMPADAADPCEGGE